MWKFLRVPSLFPKFITIQGLTAANGSKCALPSAAVDQLQDPCLIGSTGFRRGTIEFEIAGVEKSLIASDLCSMRNLRLQLTLSRSRADRSSPAAGDASLPQKAAVEDARSCSTSCQTNSATFLLSFSGLEQVEAMTKALHGGRLHYTLHCSSI